jgi:L-asparaginase type I
VPLKKGEINLLSRLEDLGVNIHSNSIMQKGSAHMDFNDVVRIAEATAAAAKAGPKGVVILHGTDTMHYTASALSFMLKDLGLPVVLTGSMIPGGDPESDSLFNLQNAITVAAFADVAEVCIVFSADMEKKRGVIIRGCRARKISSIAMNSFISVNALPIGYVENGKISYTELEVRKRTEREIKLLTKLDSNVILLKQNPALTATILARFLSGASGAVIEGTGAGHIKADMIGVIESFKGPVVMSTQTIYGGVKWGMYPDDKLLLRAKNLIAAGDMTSETAFVKLMWALGHGGDVRSIMLTNIAGELTEV